MNLKRRKEAEASSLSRMGTAILRGHKMGVTWLPDDTDDLGYTSGSARMVYVAWHHRELMKDLQDVECSMLRMGVFAHELLHQLLTNFEYTEFVTKDMGRAEAGIFMTFANTLEDPAIEYFAPNYMGGRLLGALRFSIRHIYKMSPGIEVSTNPFNQLINALIHFGDMGVVKGKFTFPESREYFKKVAPLYNKGITCPDSKERIDIAKECMEITRPLWEENVKEAEFFEELMRQLANALQKSGLHLAGNEESNMKAPESSEASERREQVVKKISSANPKKTSDEQYKGNQSGNGTDSSDFESENGSDNSNGSETGFSSLDDKSSAENSDGKKGHENPLDQKSEYGSSQSEDNSGSGGDIDTSSDGLEELTMSEDKANEVADETYEIDDAAVDEIEKSIEAEEKKVAKEECADTPSEETLPDFNISSTAFTGARCLNQRVSNASSRLASLYKDAVNEAAWEIKVLTKTLEKLFKSDCESNVRATSGSYNIMRGSTGTTARMFDKRREPDNLKDAQVMLLIDQSGSMHGSKIAQARRTAIVLAEALTNVGIPYYIMGFSADRMGYDAVHEHFVDWNNKKKDRETLVSMEAHGDNFDGYSIRYAAELLKSRNSGNKILFVISDGEPAADMYQSYRTGVSDTVNAIKTARKNCTVFGIAVGNGCSPSVLQGMYGRDFIYCQDEKLLTNTLCKKLEKVLKKN